MRYAGTGRHTELHIHIFSLLSLLLSSQFASFFILLCFFFKHSFIFPLICFCITLSLTLWSVLQFPARLLSSIILLILLSFAVLHVFFSFVIYIVSYLHIPSSILPYPFLLPSVYFPHYLFLLPSYFLTSLCFPFLFLHTFVHFLSCFCSSLFHIFNLTTASRGGRVFWGADLRPLACWNCGFESGWGHGSLPLVNVDCHQ